MALTPYQTDALLREVDDAVRKDDLESFWERYGIAIAVAVVIGLSAFGGWLYWQHHKTQVAEANSVAFGNLLKSAQGGSLDQKIYDTLVTEGGAIYKTEAQLVKAALAAGREDDAAAIATYDEVLKDPEALQPLKDAALLRKTALQFDKAKPDDVVAALSRLSTPDSAFFGSAGELTAIAHLKAGRREQAGALFASLAGDQSVPESIRLRAGQMASMLGSALPSAAAQPGTPAR
ncbi:tetratricopeptide repeat protein [Sphingobium lignivorans]|uniref:Ancillary SecYEG translocon subunit/Cell division coordinator CpoB TPR domain-containing protein n=1 Tax=Sphingobium lignivorans TaxID=2735886 RepID=A0ABR6NFI7_9SPHN|nr:tetratricopeptide repeat protein [Sphingobium lignivorans]MBB5985268.1 hypothetical protein [Sphingobium lignivorans]